MVLLICPLNLKKCLFKGVRAPLKSPSQLFLNASCNTPPHRKKRYVTSACEETETEDFVTLHHAVYKTCCVTIHDLRHGLLNSDSHVVSFLVYTFVPLEGLMVVTILDLIWTDFSPISELQSRPKELETPPLHSYSICWRPKPQLQLLSVCMNTALLVKCKTFIHEINVTVCLKA